MSKVSCVSGDTGNGDGSVVVGTDKPVFSDDSGIRAAVLKWGVWVICFVAVLLGGALALTLRIHVSTSRGKSVAAAVARTGRARDSLADEGIIKPAASAVDHIAAVDHVPADRRRPGSDSKRGR